MEDIVILVIFGLIFLVNFIIKKIAGQGTEKRTEEEPIEADQQEYNAPQDKIREFLNEVKSRTEQAQTGQVSPSVPQSNSSKRTADAVKTGTTSYQNRLNQEHQRHQRAAESAKKKKEDRAKKAKKSSADHQLNQKQKSRQPTLPKPSTEQKHRTYDLSRWTDLGRTELQKAVVMSEILGRPKGLQDL